MKNLNELQLESLLQKISAKENLNELSYNTPVFKVLDDIDYCLVVKYNYQIKVIFIIVCLEIDQQFSKQDALKIIASKELELTNSNIAYFGTCIFDENDVFALDIQELNNNQ